MDLISICFDDILFVGGEVMNCSKDITIIRELLGLSQQEFADEIGVSYETVNRWELNKNDIEEKNINKIYEFATLKKININKIYEQLFIERNDNGHKVLFHGSKKQLELPIDLRRSKKSNDFGVGFYLGELFDQAATYISNSEGNKVYAFELDLNDLKICQFNVDREWMLAVAYYRGWFDNLPKNAIVEDIVNKVTSHDVIIAPIADNRMFDIIYSFFRGEITDMQCKHALSATNLGMQYVLRTDKAINKLTLLKQMFVSSIEKDNYIKSRNEMNIISQDKVKVARIEYKRKGQYIDEILK